MINLTINGEFLQREFNSGNFYITIKNIIFEEDGNMEPFSEFPADAVLGFGQIKSISYNPGSGGLSVPTNVYDFVFNVGKYKDGNFCIPGNYLHMRLKIRVEYSDWYVGEEFVQLGVEKMFRHLMEHFKFRDNPLKTITEAFKYRHYYAQ